MKKPNPNVSGKDVKELIAQYHQKGVTAIATGIPLTDRNREIIAEMSRYLGPIGKRWRGSGWVRYDCPKANAERVSIYPRDFNRAYDWLNGEDTNPPPAKPVFDRTVALDAKIESTRESISITLDYLISYSKSVHGIIVLPEWVYNKVINQLKVIQ